MRLLEYQLSAALCRAYGWTFLWLGRAIGACCCWVPAGLRNAANDDDNTSAA